MKLKASLDSLDGVDESIAKLYEKGEDGKFHLYVEGLVPKSKLDEFRDTNVRLLKDMEKFKDVDPTKYRELLLEHQKIQEKEWIEAGELDKVVNQRVATMRAEFETKENEYKKSNESMSRQLESLLIDNEVRAAATKLGVRPTAVDDVLLRAKTIYSIKDGVVTPKNSKGEVLYGKDGTTPMPITEWVDSLKKSADHLFVPSNGGGAPGSGSITPGGGANMTPTQKIAAGLAQRAGG